MRNESSQSLRLSRRHLLKAAGVLLGAVAAALPGRAHAQENPDGGGGWGWGSCFLRGTLIQTASGYRPIETLSEGDILPARFSGQAALRRIVHYTVERGDDGQWPEDQRPVRIDAGALGDRVPAFDLFMSEAHAVFLDGVLIPIGSLVNGKTIVFDDRGEDMLEYFHLEFDRHDVIEAEGAACESHLAEGMEACAPTLAFAGGRSRLHSHLRSAMAPLMDRRRPLDRIRDGLENRAGF